MRSADLVEKPDQPGAGQLAVRGALGQAAAAGRGASRQGRPPNRVATPARCEGSAPEPSPVTAAPACCPGSSARTADKAVTSSAGAPAAPGGPAAALGGPAAAPGDAAPGCVPPGPGAGLAGPVPPTACPPRRPSDTSAAAVTRGMTRAAGQSVSDGSPSRSAAALAAATDCGGSPAPPSSFPAQGAARQKGHDLGEVGIVRRGGHAGRAGRPSREAGSPRARPGRPHHGVEAARAEQAGERAQRAGLGGRRQQAGHRPGFLGQGGGQVLTAAAAHRSRATGRAGARPTPGGGHRAPGTRRRRAPRGRGSGSGRTAACSLGAPDTAVLDRRGDRRGEPAEQLFVGHVGRHRAPAGPRRPARRRPRRGQASASMAASERPACQRPAEPAEALAGSRRPAASRRHRTARWSMTVVVLTCPSSSRCRAGSRPASSPAADGR